LADLYRLGQQLESDRYAAPEALRRRDHAIGQQCQHQDDGRMLLCWLDAVSTSAAAGQPAGPPTAQGAVVQLLRLAALAMGVVAMAGFLLASERALVNVPMFLLVFVLVQGLLCVAAAFVLLQAVRGQPPSMSALNPLRLLLRRAPAPWRTLGNNAPLLRLLLLRHGQEAGALFAAGVIVSFLVLLAFTDFSFVWGSTFAVSDRVVLGITGWLAAPWSWFLPQATVAAGLVADTRFSAAQPGLDELLAASRRGWWPFLCMCLVTYTLLPRVLLWLGSIWAYRQRLPAELLGWPGAASVLVRMRAPVVQTQALDGGRDEPQRAPPSAPISGDVLLDWAGALASLSDAPRDQLGSCLTVSAGLGSPADDVRALEAINDAAPQVLLIAVRGWEPPMADLADVLAEVRGVHSCRLLLLPLPGRKISDAQHQDWQAFARRLPFADSTVELLPGKGA
jgi:hypothetical protein